MNDKMTMMQTTIQKAVSLQGKGLHTGKEVTLTFHPAVAGAGIRFQRTDLEGDPVVPALVEYVSDTSRGTTLSDGEVRVMTVEHVMAAVAGLGIDNLLIGIDSEETPIMDGSARPFVEALQGAGISELDVPKEYIELWEPVYYKSPDGKTEYTALPAEEFRLSVMVDYDSAVIAPQYAELTDITGFSKEISPSRTFVFLHELQHLVDNNLIKGGDFSNAIVFVDKMIPEAQLKRLADLFNKPDVQVMSQGILNNIELYHPNEPARHKLLDLMGDLALLGGQLKGHVIARCPGHMHNSGFSALIRKQHQDKVNLTGPPMVDVNQPPVYDIEQIQSLLPHRPPFLLVDKILEISDRHVVGLKNVTMNEPFFVGHFPKEAVMPGVLQVEAMAQSGGILILSGVEDPSEYITYFLKIDEVRFRQRVVPGDTLIFRCVLTEPVRRGLCKMRGEAYVGKTLVAEALMLAQIVKKG
jgi:UDP-3-O-[3-hydroxymyristoyl] N-acetylglucosamine deacetylase / 3-hydroxyacyl-[acyl-carrier-protein] dehydratase